MKALHGEGLATHTGPESCAGVSNRAGEALTGVRAGRVLSRENPAPRKRASGVPTPSEKAEGHTGCADTRKARPDPARSETPGMYGRTSRGSREIPRSSAVRRDADRTGKSKDASR
jgi:hypothetical protein